LDNSIIEPKNSASLNVDDSDDLNTSLIEPDQKKNDKLGNEQKEKPKTFDGSFGN
jgi:hypothetical protein